MVLTINDEIFVPVLRFMDTLSNNKDQGVLHSATLVIDSTLLNQEIIEQLNMPMDADVLNLALKNGEKIVWTSSDFNYMEYNFEIMKNDNAIFEERHTINFLVR